MPYPTIKPFGLQPPKPPGPPGGAKPTGSIWPSFLPSSMSPQALLPKLPTGIGPAMTAAATDKTPPLSTYTHHLGGAKPVADKVLGAVQSGTRDPAQYARWASTLGAPITRAALQMPGGLLGVLGAHGLLTGGQALGDLHTLVQPLLNRAR